MANAEAGTVTVKVDADLGEFEKKINRTFVFPEPKALERPASELRLEAVKLAVRAHEALCLDGRVVDTAQAVADFVIDGTVYDEAGAATGETFKRVASAVAFDEFDEYVVEVPGRGYSGPYSNGLSEGHAVQPFLRKGDAEHDAESVRGRYVNMGLPEVAETVRVVSRKVTVARGDWNAA